MTTRRLVCVASILADVRIDVPGLPPRGGDVIGSAASVEAGGGFNILAAAARQGLDTLYAGRHGTGAYGSLIREDLAREGVACLLPPSRDGDSGFCLALVEPDGERTFITSPGVEARLGDRTLSDIPAGPDDALFVSGYDLCYPDMGPALSDWIAGLAPRTTLVLDPGPLAAEIPPAVLERVMPRVTIWTMNRREALLMSGATDPGLVRAGLRPGLPPDAMLIVRDGKEGAWLMADASSAPVPIPTPSVSVLDSTGAGDAHTGVLIASLAEGVAPVEAVARANVAASLSVTRAGPATAPTRAELDQFLAANPRFSRPGTRSAS